MKSMCLALVAWLLASNCNAQTFDAAEQNRVLKLQEEFKSGKVTICSRVLLKNGQQMLVQQADSNGIHLFFMGNGPPAGMLLDIEDLGTLGVIERVLNYGSLCGKPGGYCCAS